MTAKAKVENFRLTREQKSFQKIYRKQLKIAKVVQGRVAENMMQGAQLGQIYKQVTGQLEQMVLQAPQNTVNEIPGQTKEEPAQDGSQLR